MYEIITDLEKLETVSEPVKLIKEDGIEKEESLEIMSALREVFESNSGIYALAAKQIGINKRIFGIKFENELKFFINPILTKKKGLNVAPETFVSMPNKEILIGRPEEISAVYYTENFNYEDNKLLGPAARIFDQMMQLLDGVLPNALGLVSDILEDGPLSELSEEEIAEVVEVWKKFVKTKLEAAEKEINSDETLTKYYSSLKFTENVINERITVIEDEEKAKKYAKQQQQMAKAAQNKANFNNYVRSIK